MKQWWIYGIVMMVILVSSQTTSPSYEVESFIGKVEYSSDGKIWKPVDVGMRLSKNSWVRTGQSSEVTMTYQGKRTLQVLQQTVIQLKNLGTTETVKVKSGKIYLNVFTKLKGGEVIQVENDVAVAAVRGTRFIIDYEENEASTCTVVEGRVVLTRNVVLPAEVARDPEVKKLLTVEVKENQKLSMTMDENKSLEETIRRSKNNLAALKQALSEAQRETMSRVMAIKNAERVLEELMQYDEENSDNGEDETEDTVQKIKSKVK
ncbi:FecR domain-containing protein [Thermospira aquatica]|uniref:FecR domain-containing protein n=1 Tax=Thermospira aquatica TaxID=2828656 RepID=A0AAX3BC38_9SPIR|nr:FecR domain-containing protein [Thermospira aquatica]URA09716.1 FecR domain-containing protein [Thermospira aquatica]